MVWPSARSGPINIAFWPRCFCARWRPKHHQISQLMWWLTISHVRYAAFKIQKGIQEGGGGRGGGGEGGRLDRFRHYLMEARFSCRRMSWWDSPLLRSMEMRTAANWCDVNWRVGGRRLRWLRQSTVKYRSDSRNERRCRPLISSSQLPHNFSYSYLHRYRSIGQLRPLTGAERRGAMVPRLRSHRCRFTINPERARQILTPASPERLRHYPTEIMRRVFRWILNACRGIFIRSSGPAYHNQKVSVVSGLSGHGFGHVCAFTHTHTHTHA